MALNDDCKNRLYNWKFGQAIQYLDDQATENERDTIHALAELFGNVGWGLDGHIGTLVSAAVARLDDGYPDPEE